jgi:hypothetical protein
VLNRQRPLLIFYVGGLAHEIQGRRQGVIGSAFRFLRCPHFFLLLTSHHVKWRIRTPEILYFPLKDSSLKSFSTYMRTFTVACYREDVLSSLKGATSLLPLAYSNADLTRHYLRRVSQIWPPFRVTAGQIRPYVHINMESRYRWRSKV